MNLQSGESIRVVHPLFQVELGGSTPTSPLQLHVGEISLDMAIRLNELWHSRLPNVVKNNVQRVRHLACFCAEHDGIYYASAIWTDPIARLLNGRNWLELRRPALSLIGSKTTRQSLSFTTPYPRASISRSKIRPRSMRSPHFGSSAAARHASPSLQQSTVSVG